MEMKTRVLAEEGRQDLQIVREFELPVELLFKAYTEAELLEQWMGTKVLQLENKKYGSFLFETSDPHGNSYRFTGAVHEFVPNQKIVRTFEFENMPMGVQLELLSFESLSDDTSKLTVHTIYQSEEHRAKQLQMPFKQGLNMAHQRMEELLHKLK